VTIGLTLMSLQGFHASSTRYTTRADCTRHSVTFRPCGSRNYTPNPWSNLLPDHCPHSKCAKNFNWTSFQRPAIVELHIWRVCRAVQGADMPRLGGRDRTKARQGASFRPAD
jgi:hypothetical protein